VNLDEALISALRAEPRASVLSLSRTTGFPRAVIAERLKNLLEARDLRIVAAVHPQFSGHEVIAHVSVAARGPIQPIVDLVSARDECVLVSVVAGSYDFIMEVRVRTHRELHTMLAEVRSQPAVARIDTVIYSTVYKGYLEHEKLEQIEIDDVDRQLLRRLQADGRAGWQELAAVVGLSPSAARARVHRMLDARIVQIVVVQRRGQFGNVLTCGVGLTLDEDAGAVLPQLCEEKFVEFAVSTIGRFDAIMTVQAPSPPALYDTLESLRARPQIARIESWTHLRSIKEDYTRRL
jgi:DNA-binding Lrp family transcriptional regulator